MSESYDCCKTEIPPQETGWEMGNQEVNRSGVLAKDDHDLVISTSEHGPDNYRLERTNPPSFIPANGYGLCYKNVPPSSVSERKGYRH